MLVVATVTVSVALSPSPPVIVKLQLPAPSGVTVKVVPPLGEIVAIPPQFAVDVVNVPP
jgi:hypothetical protein